VLLGPKEPAAAPSQTVPVPPNKGKK
jgi:hypothetical protein